MYLVWELYLRFTYWNVNSFLKYVSAHEADQLNGMFNHTIAFCFAVGIRLYIRGPNTYIPLAPGHVNDCQVLDCPLTKYHGQVEDFTILTEDAID
jgi:hypothetical protein